MAQVKFYRGKKEDYNEVDHIDGVYFATNTEEVVMNGKEYGKDPDWNEIETTSPLTTWYYEDGTTYSEEIIGNLDAEKVHTPYTDCPNNTTLIKVEIGNSVRSIGDAAFAGCSGLTSVIIPNSVTSIGGSAFFSCSGLTSIVIPNSVTSVGNSAFYGCTGLTSVTIPDSVTSIGSQAFYDCESLTSVTIPDSVTSIGVQAFQECSGLTSVTIGNSVTSIGNYAFSSCSGLTSIYCNSVNEPCSVNGGTFALNNPDIIGTLYVKKGGSVSTYPTWMDDQGNLGYSGSGTWSVVEYFD